MTNKEPYIICIYKHNIVKVLFADAMSGMYPDYDTAKIIAPYEGTDTLCGVLIEDDEVIPVCETWDGFQIVWGEKYDEYDYSNNVIYEFLKEALWI
jgi:hypothetical protein